MVKVTGILQELEQRFGADVRVEGTSADSGHGQTAAPDVGHSRDGYPTVWVTKERAHELLTHLKTSPTASFPMLFDLTAIDERAREHRVGQPPSDFTVVCHLLSLDRAEFMRVKIPLMGDAPAMPTLTTVWPNANWYEREAWDMFGITFEGHPLLTRILCPPWWEGHALRKEHHARATENGGLFTMDEEDTDRMLKSLQFTPEKWGMSRGDGEHEYLFLNMGPQHPATHGILRFILKLDGEEIEDLAIDLGYHHRGAEKMGERQTWHTFIPYTDRVDYLAGVANNLPYVMAVEKLAGIKVPERAMVIRIMLAELFRIISHLVYIGTFSQDLGQMSPVFYLFNDRERAFDIVEAITGGRMHPGWFRIGGVGADLPRGWDDMVRQFTRYMRRRLKDYEIAILKNGIIKARSVGIGSVSLKEVIDWGGTGHFLRACGLEWDLRKKAPYAGYDQFEFDVPVFTHGDSYDRVRVHEAEIWQSLRIIDQCVENMPAGPYKADTLYGTPPMKERTMYDIETLIDHFLNVSWGPPVPPGEAAGIAEVPKGNAMYYLISDGGTMSYRTRIRTASFAHVQMVPMMTRGLTVPDLVAILGAQDYVLADVDR